MSDIHRRLFEYANRLFCQKVACKACGSCKYCRQFRVFVAVLEQAGISLDDLIGE